MNHNDTTATTTEEGRQEADWPGQFKRLYLALGENTGGFFVGLAGAALESIFYKSSSELAQAYGMVYVCINTVVSRERGG